MIIGIIGGGQLGMMMAEAAKKYNHTIIGLDPNKNCPLSNVADEIIVASYDDELSIKQLIDISDVVTYEFENVDLDLVDRYKEKIPQKSKALYYSRNRLIEKKLASSLGIRTPKYRKFNSESAFFPAIVKTTTGGYDGKGQYVFKNLQDIDQSTINLDTEHIIEEFIDFDYEISVIATRDKFGNIVVYPIPINKHKNGILFTSEVFDEIDPLIVSKAKEYTSKIIEELDYIGTLAVEYFVKGEEVLFNEFAPRPHNSGHYTIEGCTVSQFENHVRAIVGESVLQSSLKSPTIMVNVLGQDNAYIKRIDHSGVYYHDYKKGDSRITRKMGHITIVSDTVNEAISIRNDIIKE